MKLDSILTSSTQHLTTSDIQRRYAGRSRIFANLTDSSGVAALDERITGDVDLNIASVGSAGIDHDRGAIIGHAASDRVRIRQLVVIVNTQHLAAADIQRTGFNADAAITLDRTASNVHLARLRYKHRHLLGFHNSAIEDVDLSFRQIRTVARNGKALLALYMTINVQLRCIAGGFAADKDSRLTKAGIRRVKSTFLANRNFCTTSDVQQSISCYRASDRHIAQRQFAAALGADSPVRAGINRTILNNNICASLHQDHGFRIVGHGLAIEVDRNVFRNNGNAIVVRISQQDRRLTVSGCLNTLAYATIRLDRVAVSIHQLDSHVGLSREGAILVLSDADTLSRVAGNLAVHSLLRGDVGVEVLKRTTLDGNLGTAVGVGIVDAVNEVSVRALAIRHLLEQGEFAAIDGQRALLHLNRADVADKRTILDGQAAVNNIEGIAVVLLGLDGAVTGDGHLSAALNGDQRNICVAPDVHGVVDLLAVQIQRDVLLDHQAAVLLDVGQQLHGAVLGSSLDGSFQRGVLHVVDFSDLLLLNGVSVVGAVVGGDVAGLHVGSAFTLGVRAGVEALERTAGDDDIGTVLVVLILAVQRPLGGSALILATRDLDGAETNIDQVEVIGSARGPLPVGAARKRNLGSGRPHIHCHGRLATLNRSDGTIAGDGQVSLLSHIEHTVGATASDIVVVQVNGDLALDGVIRVGIVDILHQNDGILIALLSRSLSRSDSLAECAIVDTVHGSNRVNRDQCVHTRLILLGLITSSQSCAVERGVSGELAAGNQNLGITRQRGIVRLFIEDQRSAGDLVLVVADPARAIAGAVERTARDLHITGASNDAGTIFNVEGTAADGDVVLPRCVDTAGDVTLGLNAAVESTALNGNLIGLTLTVAAVASDDGIIGSDKRTILNIDRGAGRLAGDHRALAALKCTRGNLQVSVVANSHSHARFGHDLASAGSITRTHNRQLAVVDQGIALSGDAVPPQVQGNRSTGVIDNNSFRQRDVLQQPHGMAVRSRVDGFLQRLELSLACGVIGNIRAYLDTVQAVSVRFSGDVASLAQILGNLAGEATAGDRDIGVGSEVSRFLVRPVVGLDGVVASLGSKLTAGDLDLVQTLVAGAVHDGDGRAVLNGAVILGLYDRVAGNRDRAAVIDAQAAGADLNAHGLGGDLAVVDGQRAAAGEVDAEAVGDIQRTVLQRDGIVGVVAVGLDTAAGGGRHLDAIEHQTGIVIGDGAAHGGGDQTHQLAADHLAVLHGQHRIGVVDLEGRAVCIRAGAGPGVAVQIHRAVNAAGVER